MTKFGKTKKLTAINMMIAVCIGLLVVSAGAQLFNYFVTQQTNVNVESLELYWDDTLAQDLNVVQDMDVIAGSSNTTHHTLQWLAGDGTDNLNVTFSFNELETGLNATIEFCGEDITELTMTKGVIYNLNLTISAHPMMKSATNLPVNMTLDVPGW